LFLKINPLLISVLRRLPSDLYLSDDMRDSKPDLWVSVTSHEALQQAWYKVLANEGCAGGDGVTLQEFQGNMFANVVQLRAELLGGTYRSGPFRKLSVPKKKPGYRILTIPSVRDRIVHTSIANAHRAR